MTHHIDTLKTNREFLKSGMSKKISDAITKKFIEVEKSNKKEFVNVKTFNSEIKALRQDFKNDFNILRSELNDTKYELKGEISLVKQEFKLIRQEIKTAMLAAVIGLGKIMALIEKFL